MLVGCSDYSVRIKFMNWLASLGASGFIVKVEPVRGRLNTHKGDRDV